MIFCLNLPYALWYKPKNTFFAGIILPPYEPNMITIISLLDPIVEQLQEFYLGQNICIHGHPNGKFTRLAVLCAIGNSLAIWKVLGYAGIVSYHLCTFCILKQSDVECLDPSVLYHCVRAEVIIAAEQWW